MSFYRTEPAPEAQYFLSSVPLLIGLDAPVYLLLIVVLFAYALRYYIFAPVALTCRNTKAESESETLWEEPFVSILLPLYNEKNVVNRLLTACSSVDYTNYEVIVIDDSTDETTEKVKAWTNQKGLKIIQRTTRERWKAGALNEGLRNLDSRSEYVLVFDADFVPRRDILKRFALRFASNPGVEVLQGYQKHDLNADENWITKGVRIFHSTAYKVDLEARARLGMMVPVMGSVFMMKTLLAKQFRFEHDITEDYNLALRLYLNSHRVCYDSSLAVSGECPSTLPRVIKQIGRWAEGTTRDTREYLPQAIKSSTMSSRVKFDFVMSGFSYMSSLFLLCVTVIGLANVYYLEAVLTYPIISSAVILSTLALPATALAQSLALLRDDERRSIRNVPFSLFLSYILVPVVSYYSIRGLLTKAKSFERTFKTGKTVKKLELIIPADKQEKDRVTHAST